MCPISGNDYKTISQYLIQSSYTNKLLFAGRFKHFVKVKVSFNKDIVFTGLQLDASSSETKIRYTLMDHYSDTKKPRAENGVQHKHDLRVTVQIDRRSQLVYFKENTSSMLPSQQTLSMNVKMQRRLNLEFVFSTVFFFFFVKFREVIPIFLHIQI